MAATGYTPISLYYSTTASAVPTAGNLANGELALNIADMKLYAKNSAGTVTLLASNASTTGVDSLSFGSTGLTPSTATTGAITVAGTLNVANGGTGSTSLTAGHVLFGAGTSAVGNSANLFWDNGNSRLGIGTATPRGPIDAIGRSYFQASGSNNVLTLVNTSGGDGSIQVTGTSTTLNYAFNTYSTSNALYIQNDGNVGIGTSSPSTKLTVRGVTFTDNGATGGASGLVYAMSASSGGNFGQIGNTGTRWSLGYGSSLTALGTEVLVWNDSGNVGIGTSSPSYPLHVNATGNGTKARFTNGTTTLDLYCGGTEVYTGTAGSSTSWAYANANTYMAGYVNGAERVRISAAGGFSVGTTADPGAGAIYATGNITAYYSSDIKFKENVRDIPDALATVNAIGGKLFNWTDEYIESKGGADGYFVQKADFGVVAQDVQKVFPIAVRTRPDGSLAVDYEKLGALAFAALVELTKRVEALETN